MSERQLNLTPEQETAVKYRGGALLVSAAAGSGKTKVLVERLLGRIGKEDSISEFLVITYTRAAASELREKIYEGIMKRLADEPENRSLRRQSLLCRGASIGTIHSFCTDILRENAHFVGLPPDFRVADESEGDMIKAEALEDVLNEAYEAMPDGFVELVDTFSAGRDDRRLSRIVLDVHSKLQSDPYPRKWAAGQSERLNMDGVKDVSETVWGKLLIGRARKTASYWLEEMERVRAEAASLPDFEKAYGESIAETCADIEAFLGALDRGWDEARKFRGIGFPKAKPVKGYEDLKETRKLCTKAMGKCSGIFECSSDEHIEDMRAVAPAMAALMRLVLGFDSAYAEEKRRRRAVDFSDLEHLALSLLIDGETGEKTGLARAISGRFKEIMVDEYQDVNAVQELIFNAVSRDGRNIFMVGDVKQSIYRFRLADPSIFLEKYRRFHEAGAGAGPGVPGSELMGAGPESSGGAHGGTSGGADGAKIHLSRNFRSRAGILDAVNLVFERIMSAEFGEMDYTERERLVPGNPGSRNPGPECEDGHEVEIDVIDMSGFEQGDEDENPAKTQVEARFVAERIKGLTGGAYTIPGASGESRPIKCSDIAILLRSVRDKAWQYAAALAELGIPADMPGGEGFFETVEISAALSLLSVIDNPMQDIPLASALRGPVYGFAPDELAEIRAGSRDSDFYGALVRAAEAGAGPVALREKCAAFLRDVGAMREVMPDMAADRFIWHVYNKTGLLELVGAMHGGDRRRDNLILLAEAAHGFEQSGYKGIFGFLTYIEGLRERGAELVRDTAAPASAAAAVDAVRIMSIHKSKGLEFPVVILADTSKRMNYQDSQQPLVLHHELGAGPMRTDRQRRIEYATLARMAIQSKLTSEMLAEELRVLYVAMTRAREKLIVTATFKDAEKEIEKLSRLGQMAGAAPGEGEKPSVKRIAPQVLEDIPSTAGWILAAGLGSSIPITVHKSLAGNEGAGEGNGELKIENGKLGDGDRGVGNGKLRIENGKLVGSDREKENETPEPEFKHSEEDRGVPGEPGDRVEFDYPYPLAPDLPSKLTVTGLKGKNIEPDAEAEPLRWLPGEEENSGAVQSPEIQTSGSKLRFAFERPDFITKKTGLSAAERGTALHLALQQIDFQKCGSETGIAGEIGRLSEKGLLTQEQAAAVDASVLSRFFGSELGKRVLNAEKSWREFKFSLLYPAERFYKGGGEDKILLQGVVDCFFEEGGELTVIDFKTDYVTPETLEEKAAHYAPQLAAYADALERITRKRVKERVLYFFTIGASYSLVP